MTGGNRTMMRFQWRMHKLAWKLSGGRLMRRIGKMPVVELITMGQIGTGTPDPHHLHRRRRSAAIVGTNAGRDVDPAWVKNLRARPRARARWDGGWHDVTAVELTGEDHARLWAPVVAVNPHTPTKRPR